MERIVEQVHLAYFDQAVQIVQVEYIASHWLCIPINKRYIFHLNLQVGFHRLLQKDLNF